MKRLSLLLVAILLFPLAACGTPATTEAPTAAPTETPTSAPTEAPTVMTTAPAVATNTSAEQADLVISNMQVVLVGYNGTCAPSWQGGNELRLSVQNLGSIAAGSFVITVNGAQQSIHEGLAAGQSMQLTFPAVATNIAIVDATNQVAERDESNNTRSLSAPTMTPPPLCTPTPAANAITETPVAAPNAVPIATYTAELSATVVASLPPTPTPDQANGTGGFGLEGVTAQALKSPDGWPQLWAVASHGMSMGDPTQTHFVAIYTHKGDAWQQLDRVELTDDDFLDPTGLAQVDIEPTNVWLEAQGGAGAHSGCYDLLRFDGKQLHSEVSSCSSSPGDSRLEDVNGDGKLDVVLDATDYYVFCYACGVRAINYTVMRWDGQKMVEVKLAALAGSGPSELHDLTNQAVGLAQAGLWKDAQATISQTLFLQEFNPDAKWDAGLINLTAAARAEQAQSGAYPLLDNLYYGDYPAVLNIMRAHKPGELFSAQTTLINGTTAEGWQQQVTDEITRTTDLALTFKPDLAAAYFLRGWGVHLTDPSNPSVLADIERAAQLDPKEALFSDSLAFLRKQ